MEEEFRVVRVGMEGKLGELEKELNMTKNVVK